MNLPVPDLVSQRSMLVILIAACSTARTAFEAADNAVDAELCADLNRLIERSEAELEKLNRAIDERSGGGTGQDQAGPAADVRSRPGLDGPDVG